eukprot:6201208-Pleurochrysis_carterae.AAC.2
MVSIVHRMQSCARELAAGPLLNETVDRLRAAEQPLRMAANLHKQTVLVDGWDDVERNHLVNVLVASAKGMFFQGTKKLLLSGDHEDAELVADIIMAGMKSAGALNVVQVFTNTCSVMRAAWRLVEEQYPW